MITNSLYGFSYHVKTNNVILKIIFCHKNQQIPLSLSQNVILNDEVNSQLIGI